MSSPPGPLQEGKGSPGRGRVASAAPEVWAGSPWLRLLWALVALARNTAQHAWPEPQDSGWVWLLLLTHRHPSLIMRQSRKIEVLRYRLVFRKWGCSGDQAVSSGQDACRHEGQGLGAAISQ